MEKPLKVITAAPVIQRMMRYLGYPKSADYPDFLAMTDEKIFLIDDEKKEKKDFGEIEKKDEIEHCSLKEWVQIIEKEQIEKIFIDQSVPTKIIIALQPLKKISFAETPTYLNQQEIKKLFREKKKDHHANILHQQIRCMPVESVQIKTWTQANLITQMAFICSYHKIHQGAYVQEIEEEMQHYVLSKSHSLPDTKMSCQVKSFLIPKDHTSVMEVQEKISNHQAVCFSILGQAQGLRLQNCRMVAVGEICDSPFFHAYQQAQKNYLFFQKAFSQEKKKKISVRDIVSEWSQINKKNNSMPRQMPLAQLSFSEKFDLDLLPDILEHWGKREILSIFFPSPLKPLCLHAIIETDAQKQNIVALSEDRLELLRFLR